MSKMSAAYHKAYRARRKAEGRPVPSGKAMPRSYHQAYELTYKERPGILQHRAAYARLRRTDVVEQVKGIARRLLRSAIDAGQLAREACSVCGDRRTDGHHDDYEYPLQVRWLCRQHHMAIHKKARGE